MPAQKEHPEMFMTICQRNEIIRRNKKQQETQAWMLHDNTLGDSLE